jgi:hypothetical protein
MVGMCVRDDGTINRPPGVDVEIARRAVKASGAQGDEIVDGKLRRNQNTRTLQGALPSWRIPI